MNKSLSYVNLSLLFQHFDWDLTHQVLFLYILPSHHIMNLRNQPWKMFILWCRTDICSCKFSAKISFMLDNPFLVLSLCILNGISLCFIQISTKSGYSLQGKQCFFGKYYNQTSILTLQSHSGVLGPWQHGKDFY